MPPKRKSNRKNDDWDAGLGEDVDPIGAATKEAKDDEAAVDAAAQDHESTGSGGLLAALKKNRGKKAKKGKVVEEIPKGEDVEPTLEDVNGVNGDTAPPPVDLDSKAPQEASMEDEVLFGEAGGKKGKAGKGGAKPGKQQQQLQSTKNEDDEEEEDDGSGKVKTKKEKEKEKREREKQRKKEQASKKKTAAPTPAPKQDAPKAEAAPTHDPSLSAPDAAGKKKKLPPHLAQIQKQQEELRRKREEEEKLERESKEKLEQIERKEKEEQQKKEEAKAAKKQRDKEKVEQQKREGTYKTKAQKEAEAQAKARMQQMIDSGAKVAGLSSTAEDKKRPTYDKKKKASKKAEEAKKEEEEAAAQAEAQRKMHELRIREEQEAAAQAEAEKARAEAEEKKEESGGEDWEAQADAMDDVKDSWDAPSDAEDQKPQTTTPAVNGKPVPAGSTAKPAKVVEHSSDEDSDEGESSSEEEEERTSAQREAAARKQEAAERRERKHQEALAARSKENLRSPICCILGHVDTGKTKLLDKVRQTNVQEGEAGGITQQIGATYFPVEALQKKVSPVNKDGKFEFKVPGLLIIDTPGHESFTNLRSRGSSLCNIAILVVDIMHGLEPQTLESMRLLRERKTPFIVALNKIDRLYGWSRIDNNGFQDSLAMQKKSVVAEFERRLEQTKLLFAEQGFNSELFYENKSMARNVSLVPTSAHTGEGVPDLLKLLVSLSQERMTNALMYLSEVECTILEVKVIEGLGTTIDVVLSNGILREGDRIVLCGTNGPISTNIRALLTPAEMKELRVKSAYVHNKEVKAALGVKISANDLDHAIAGSRLMVVGEDDDEEDMEEQVMSDLENLLSKISRTGRGVSVQASTLGSLEALLEFLKVSKIPVANISIGPVYKRDIMQTGVMLEKAKEYAVMLAFDVKVDKEAQQYADEVGVKVFTADIIYHLFDDFTKHLSQLAEQRKEESKLLAVFPCVLKTVAVFNKKDPIVLGVDVAEGSLRNLTPLAAVKNNPITGVKEVINLGRV